MVQSANACPPAHISFEAENPCIWLLLWCQSEQKTAVGIVWTRINMTELHLKTFRAAARQWKKNCPLSAMAGRCKMIEVLLNKHGDTVCLPGVMISDTWPYTRSHGGIVAPVWTTMCMSTLIPEPQQETDISVSCRGVSCYSGHYVNLGLLKNLISSWWCVFH